MPTEILQTLAASGAIVFADATDFSPPAGAHARTHQIDLTSLAAGAARQSDKADLTADRAHVYRVMVAFEFATAPTSLELVNVYLAQSSSGTAANLNPGGVSGSDSAYTGTAGDSLADSLTQLDRVGSLSLTADATTVVQYGSVGLVHDLERYVSVIVENATASDAFVADAVEMYVALVPLATEEQSA